MMLLISVICVFKVMEAYRKVQIAKQKKKTPTKKEREAVVKALKDREQIVKALDVWAPLLYIHVTCDGDLIRAPWALRSVELCGQGKEFLVLGRVTVNLVLFSRYWVLIISQETSRKARKHRMQDFHRTGQHFSWTRFVKDDNDQNLISVLL